MRILPVNLFTKHRRINENNHNDYSQNKLFILPRKLNRDTVSFSGSIMSGKDFKELNRYMTCLYSGEKMLSGKQLTKMKKRGFFEGPIIDVVRKLQPYKKKYLKNIELEVFERIEKASEKTPYIDMPQLFKNIYKETRSNFRKTQKPSFDKIKTLGAELPDDYIEPFYKFMETVDRKLYDEPVKQTFSLKEFTYKINKTCEKMSDINLKNRIQKLIDILHHENFENKNKPLPSSLIKQVFDFKNIKLPGRGKKTALYDKYFKQYEWDKDSVKIEIISQIKEAAAEKGYKKLERFCDNNIGMIKGIPVHIPFSNKAFVYDLSKLLENMPDLKLKQEILGIAQNLPSSSRSADALILKFRDADPNIIGDRLFNPALVSIEHIKPSSEGGADSITNYALAKRSINSDRLSTPLWQFLKNYPVENQQKYVDNLIKLVNNGKLKYEDALAQIEAIQREGHLTLDYSKLKKMPNPFTEILKEKFIIKD